MTEFSRKNPDQKIRRSSSGRDAISAVKLSETLTAQIDAWAEAHDTARSDAIRQLIQLGLGVKASTAASASPHRDPHDIERFPVLRAIYDELRSDAFARRMTAFAGSSVELACYSFLVTMTWPGLSWSLKRDSLR